MTALLQTAFFAVWDRALGAFWLVLAAVALRPLLKGLPARLRCWLWMAAGLRLVLPPFYVSWAVAPQPSLRAAADGRNAPLDAMNSSVGVVVAENPAAVTRMPDLWRWAGVVWAAGVAVMLLWALVSALRLRRRLAEAVPVPDEKDLWQCAAVDTPFVFGLLRPRVYLPFSLDPAALPYVVAHERAHIARRDHLTKAAAFVLLAVWWCVPWLWLAWVLLGRDIEAACDERVLAGLDAFGKKDYARALLACSAPRRALALCPVAFGEIDVKTRIQNVLRWHKPAVWAVAAGVLLAAALVVVLWPSRRPDLDIILSREYDTELVYQIPVFDSVADAGRVTLSPEYIVSVKDGVERIFWGTLQPTRLTAARFDELFFAYDLDGSEQAKQEYWTYARSPAALRRGNYKTWRVDVAETAGSPQEYYLLLVQRDGTVYLAQGYAGAEGADYLRALFLLTPVSAAEYNEPPAAIGAAPETPGTEDTETTDADPYPAGTRWQFAETLYVNPLSSQIYTEGEGCWYIIGEGFSAVRDGDIMTTYPNGGLQWYDYAAEDWQALFVVPGFQQPLPELGADAVPRADIDVQDFLLAVGDDIWLVRGTASIETIGPWAVLRLVPAE